MRTSKQRPMIVKDSWLRTGLFFLLLFMLFAEWLRPLTQMAQVTDLYIIKPLILAVGCFLFTDYVRTPPLLGWLLKVLLSIATVILLFHPWILLDRAGWSELTTIIIGDGTAIFRGDLHLLSGQTRTFVFLICWALLISVVQSIILEKRRGLWFVVATILYLVGLQFWPGVDTHYAIMRTFVAGMILLSLLNLPRLEGNQVVSGKMKGWPVLWVISSLLLVGASSAVGLYLSSTASKDVEPITLNWLEDISFRTVSSPLSSSTGLAKSGYSSDDTHLGGGIVEDDQVVFIAHTDQLTYWRGESKNLYNGKGWSQRKSDLLRLRLNSQLPSLLYAAQDTPRDTVQDTKKDATQDTPRDTVQDSAQDTVQEITELSEDPYIPQNTNSGPDTWITPITSITQEILLNGNQVRKPLFSGGAITHIDVEVQESDLASSEADQRLLIDPVAAKYMFESSTATGSLSYYKLQVDLPNWDEEVLRQDQTPYPVEIALLNLQLPEELPHRVKKLASQITAEHTNRYDQVKAIETYLHNHYSYSLDKPTFPKQSEDFVDHFLFMQKVGYCDHFSTSMAVLLRSIGIPARWVKGFAPGELNYMDTTAMDTNMHTNANSSADTKSARQPMTVTIRNLHAHSWVEVYFPGAGWVPFEPTPGFTGNALLLNGLDDKVDQALIQVQPTQIADSQQMGEGGVQKSMIERRWSELASASIIWLNRWFHSLSASWKQLSKANILLSGLIALTIVLALGAGTLIFHKRLFLRIVMRHYDQARRNPEVLIHILDKMWVKLVRKFGPLQKQQTLREYVVSLQLPDGKRRQALVEFAQIYESLRYDKPQRTLLTRSELIQRWRNVID